jgi:hypothetical protein
MMSKCTLPKPEANSNTSAPCTFRDGHAEFSAHSWLFLLAQVFPCHRRYVNCWLIFKPFEGFHLAEFFRAEWPQSEILILPRMQLMQPTDIIGIVIALAALSKLVFF